MKANLIKKYFMLLFFTSVIITNIFSSINDLTRFAYYFLYIWDCSFCWFLLEFKKKVLILLDYIYMELLLFFYSLKVDQKLNNQKQNIFPIIVFFINWRCFFYDGDWLFSWRSIGCWIIIIIYVLISIFFRINLSRHKTYKTIIKRSCNCRSLIKYFLKKR
jgi:hypothetical protein